MMEKDMKDMVDYIELTNDVIRDLSGRPSLRKESMEKTAGALTAAGIIPRDASAAVLETWSKDPNKVLELVEKMAGMVNIDNARGFDIGSPVGVTKKASKESEADRAFKSRLGL